MNRKYTLLGKDEGSAICQFCHKKEISKLFIVQDNDSGEILYFGSTCIHKALKISADEWKEMKARHALASLTSPYPYKIQTGNNWGISTQVSMEFEGETYSRTWTGKRTEKQIITHGQWVKGGYVRYLSKEALKPMRIYIQTKARLEKQLAALNQG